MVIIYLYIRQIGGFFVASAAKFRQLKVLKSVADCGSMTRAAQSLGISQPAVSRVISDLTELFGFSLFEITLLTAG